MTRTLQTANLAAWSLNAVLRIDGGAWSLYEAGSVGVTLWLMAWLWLALMETV